MQLRKKWEAEIHLELGGFGAEFMQLLLWYHSLLRDVAVAVHISRCIQIDVFRGIENVFDDPREPPIGAHLGQIRVKRGVHIH